MAKDLAFMAMGTWIYTQYISVSWYTAPGVINQQAGSAGCMLVEFRSSMCHSEKGSLLLTKFLLSQLLIS